jgi:hypothetical protein
MVEDMGFAFVLDYFAEFVVEELDCIIFKLLFKFLQGSSILSFIILIRHVIFKSY